MSYIVKIDKFEGPLDLLLHLIKTNELDIYMLSITDITIQYIDYIKAMENLNLEVASEYLVMAADLIRIKSLMLLPKKKIFDDELVIEEDPKLQLIEKLIEYKKFKGVSEEFEEYKDEREMIYSKIYNEEFEVNSPIIIDNNLEIFDLIKSLQKMHRRKEALKPLTTVIEKHEITVEARMDTLYCYLRTIQTNELFSNLFDIYDKSFIITTFLAILELVKENKIEIINVLSDDFEIKIIGGDSNE